MESLSVKELFFFILLITSCLFLKTTIEQCASSSIDIKILWPHGLFGHGMDLEGKWIDCLFPTSNISEANWRTPDTGWPGEPSLSIIENMGIAVESEAVPVL